MRALAALGADRTEAFARAYLDATCKQIGEPEGGASGTDLESRVARAREVAAVWGGAEERLRVENECARALFVRGRLAEAERILTSARASFPDARRNLGELTVLLGSLAAERCDFDAASDLQEEAEERLEQQLAEARPSGDAPYLLEQLLWLQGDRVHTFLELGMLDRASSALEHEEGFLAELRSIAPAPAAERQLVQDRSRVALASQRFEDARDDLARYLDANPDLPEEARGVLQLLRAVSISELARESRADPDSAAALLRDLVASGRLDEVGVHDARLVLTDLALRRGELAEARADLAWFESEEARARSTPNPCGAEEEEARIVALKTRLALAEGAAPSELAPLRDALESAYARFLERWVALRPRPGGTGFLHWGNQREVISERIRVELALDGSERGTELAFDVALRAQRLGSLARRLGARTPTLAEVRRHLLPRGVGLLLYMPSTERSHLFLVDADRIRHFELRSRDEILAAVRPWAELDRLLPVDAWPLISAWSGLYVSGTDLLSNPPFECLSIDDGSLGSTRAIAYLPSVPAAVALAERLEREEGAARTSDLVLVAPDAPEERAGPRWSELPRLPLSAQQETDLVSAFPSARVIRLVGSGATLTRFIELPLRSAAVLSIVAHGIYDAGRDWSAGLLLSPTSSSDGVLSIEDIEGLDSVPPIVALWACSSARGHVRLGDDATAQLAFAFLARGASAVIVIRAAVSQREAVELAGEFHRCLATAADSPAEALRVARRRVEERHPSRDPFECGITSVIGLGLRTSLHPARTGPREGTSPARFAVRIPWILAGLGCALAAGAWARRRRRS